MKFKTIEEAKAWLLDENKDMTDEMATKLAPNFLEENEIPPPPTPAEKASDGSMEKLMKTFIDYQAKHNAELAETKVALEKITADQVERFKELENEKIEFRRDGMFNLLTASDKDFAGIDIDQKQLVTDLGEKSIELEIVRQIMGYKVGREIGYGELPMRSVNSIMNSMMSRDQWSKHVRSLPPHPKTYAFRTMRPGSTGAGEEFIMTAVASTFIDQVRIATNLLPNIEMFQMPTNPYTWPLSGTDIKLFFLGRGAGTTGDQGGGATAVTIEPSDRKTSNLTWNAGKLGALVYYDDDIVEDSIIAMLPYLRNGMIVSTAEQMEYAVIMGDNSTGATGNINSDDAAPSVASGAADYYLIYDGLVENCLTAGATQTVDASGTLALSHFNTARSRMDKYGLYSDKAAFILGAETAVRVAQLLTAEASTNFNSGMVVNGEATRVGGLPIIVSGGLPLTDDDGKVTTLTPSANDQLNAVGFNKAEVMLGIRKNMTMETYRFSSQQNALTMVLRQDLQFPHDGDDIFVYLYNAD